MKKRSLLDDVLSSLGLGGAAGAVAGAAGGASGQGQGQAQGGIIRQTITIGAPQAALLNATALEKTVTRTETVTVTAAAGEGGIVANPKNPAQPALSGVNGNEGA